MILPFEDKGRGGTPPSTSVSLSGNAQFTGVIVAPNALLGMSGGGNNTMDFSGAVMARSIKLQGKFNFHYDEALGRLGGTGRYLVSSWDEIVSNQDSRTR